MKEKIILTIVCVNALLVNVGADTLEILKAMSEDKSRIIGETNGAQAKEILHVIDQDGMPVMNAQIYGSFWPSNNGEKYVLVNGLTNADGELVVTGVSKWKLTLRVSKTGYYTSNETIDYLASTNVPVIANGKWQPYGSRRSIVLKKIENPQTLVCWNRTRKNTIPAYGKWLAFDFERCQFVAPYGGGIMPDVLLRFTLDTPSKKEYHMKMDVSFTNMPYAGAYLMKKDEFSDFKSVYHADTNSNYQQSFSYNFDRYPHQRPIVHELGEDEYLVFRTRTKVDKKGRLKSTNYGVLYGLWSFVGPGGMKISFLAFNPTPNDTNLEPKP
jgi:hypothetical protein